MQNLVDLISVNRKDLKFKQALLPALGELIYLISCQVGMIHYFSDENTFQ